MDGAAQLALPKRPYVSLDRGYHDRPSAEALFEALERGTFVRVSAPPADLSPVGKGASKRWLVDISAVAAPGPGPVWLHEEFPTAEQAIDRNAKGPAPEVPGAHKGGTLTVYSQSTPNTLDPTNVYYTDSSEISRLLYRTTTSHASRSRPTWDW